MGKVKELFMQQREEEENGIYIPKIPITKFIAHLNHDDNTNTFMYNNEDELKSLLKTHLNEEFVLKGHKFHGAYHIKIITDSGKFFILKQYNTTTLHIKSK